MDNTTICALATPAGGAIGVVRVSGPNAISITAAKSLNVIFAGIRNLLHVGGCDSLIVTFIS